MKIAPDGGDTVWDEVIKQDRNQQGRGNSVWHGGACTTASMAEITEQENLRGVDVGMKQMGLPPLFKACKPPWEDIFCPRPLPCQACEASRLQPRLS